MYVCVGYSNKFCLHYMYMYNIQHEAIASKRCLKLINTLLLSPSSFVKLWAPDTHMVFVFVFYFNE